MNRFLKALLTLKKEEPAPPSTVKTREDELAEISIILTNKLQEYAILAMSTNIMSAELQSRASNINREIIFISEKLLGLDLHSASIGNIRAGMEELTKLLDDYKMVVTN